jgi:PAS domain S-box-containing protein
VKNKLPALLLNERPVKEQLRLKNRALTTCAEGVTIADATQPDCPLIYVNRGFEKLTGYSATETCGTNCRFLQGRDTDPAAVEEIRRAVKEKRECVVEILNYRKSGEQFWNRLSITPIYDKQGTVTHFIGVQSDVTARRNAEAALRVANAELERANRLIRKDLEAAAKIQASFLPSKELTLKGVSAAWNLIPCDELAGDTLNVYRLNDRYSAFYVIDVSGHGVQAALLSATLNHWIGPETGKVNEGGSVPADSDSLKVPSPVDVLTQLNQQFPFDPDVGQYFTLVYGIFDSQTRVFRFVAAGHPSPIYVPAGGVPQIQKSYNFPIGVVDNPSYEEITIQMNPGDRMYLYSDGLVDVKNARGEHYDTARLIEILDTLSSMSLKSGLSFLIDQLNEWSGEDNLQDDVSILGFEIN